MNDNTSIQLVSCLALKKVDTKVNKEWQTEKQKQGMRRSI